jgi:cytochrome c peroxidase
MHLSWTEAAAKLNANSTYVDEFKKAFGISTIDSNYVVKAIAQFMRTMISYNSRLDKRLRNEISLTSSELNGYVIYVTERGDCFHCHNIDAGLLMTDNLFHNNGLDSVFTDLGRGAITGNAFDNGKFLTPTLRNIALTAPYMHDGRFQTLEEVVEHYNSGGKASSTIDPLMKHVGTGLNLNTQEKADLVAFLKTMTDSSFINDERFKSPF